jgi:hypothetical protein
MVGQKWTATNTKPASVAPMAGAAEVDHAIATLVLAFGTHPVARWMYDDPHKYLLHLLLLFRTLGTASFEAEATQRTSDGVGVAFWLPPGVHGDDKALEAAIAESINGEKQAEVGSAFEQTGHYRPTEPHWYPFADRRRVFASEQGVRCGSTATRPSPMRPSAPPCLSLVVEPAEYLALREAWR